MKQSYEEYINRLNEVIALSEEILAKGYDKENYAEEAIHDEILWLSNCLKNTKENVKIFSKNN